MTKHYDGYEEVRHRVLTYPLEYLLGLIDDLYGREHLHYGDRIEDVRAEALRQLDKDWTVLP